MRRLTRAEFASIALALGWWGGWGILGFSVLDVLSALFKGSAASVVAKEAIRGGAVGAAWGLVMWSYFTGAALAKQSLRRAFDYRYPAWRMEVVKIGLWFAAAVATASILGDFIKYGLQTFAGRKWNLERMLANMPSTVGVFALLAFGTVAYFAYQMEKNAGAD